MANPQRCRRQSRTTTVRSDVEAVPHGAGQGHPRSGLYVCGHRVPEEALRTERHRAPLPPGARRRSNREPDRRMDRTSRPQPIDPNPISEPHKHKRCKITPEPALINHVGNIAESASELRKLCSWFSRHSVNGSRCYVSSATRSPSIVHGWSATRTGRWRAWRRVEDALAGCGVRQSAGLFSSPRRRPRVPGRSARPRRSG